MDTQGVNTTFMAKLEICSCLGTQVLRHSAGSIGTYDRTYVRTSNRIHNQ